MKCAIVTLEKNDGKNTSFWDKIKPKRNKISYTEVICATHPICIYTIGCSVGEACEYSEKKINSVIDKCVRSLEKNGIESVYLTDEVLDFFPCEKFFRHFKVPTGTRLFNLLLRDVVLWCANQKGIDISSSSAAIWHSRFDEYSYKSIERLSTEFKYLTLCTNDADEAVKYADRLYADMGLSAKVSKNSSELNLFDIVVTFDKTPNPVLNEQAVIIDESGQYAFRCKNTIEFSLPFGLNVLMDYFGICHQRCVEFLFDCCDVNIARTDNIYTELENIGCKFKKVLYKPHKNLDKP
ncbi:MAG: hypothetical protein E7410_03130 [Ruminococcaceae bacterium]|nr:hypothetical protein [Oscillospiraceae bacterium]